MQPTASLSAIIAPYDAVLLDLWGVVHDGSQLYPGAKEAMAQLKAADKRIMLVSNAPRRAAKAQIVLRQLGVSDEMYDHIITSGEIGYRWLKEGRQGWGRRYFFIGPTRDSDVLDGLDYQRVHDVRQTDFLLNVGFGSEEESAANWQPLLIEAAGRALPMLCLNPDMEVVKISGERFPCAGVLAADYQRLGGSVTYFGKPHQAIYDYCFDVLGCREAKVLVIGDGLATDIKGAAQAGVDAVFITGGIFQHEKESVEEVCRKHALSPRYVMPSLVW
jgi:HAD superfamily hydrolase (TIGR01459 family)